MGRYIKTPDTIIKENGIRRTISGVLAIVMLITAIPAVALFTGIIGKEASAGTWTKDNGFTIPARNGSLGTKENPFTVLEIVPNESMASFGYLVQGQEPVDISKVREDKPDIDLEDYIANDYGSREVEAIEYKSVLDDKLKKGEITEEEYNKYELSEYNDARQYGTYKYAGDNKGDYLLTEVQGYTDEFEHVGDGKGDYSKSAIYKLADDTFDGNAEYYEIEKVDSEWKYDHSIQYTPWYKEDFYVSKGDYKIEEVLKSGESVTYKYVYDTEDAHFPYWVTTDQYNSTMNAKYNIVFKPVKVSEDDFNKDKYKYNNRNISYYVVDGKSEYVSDKNGNYIRKPKYTYKLTKVESGKGNYTFESMSYNDYDKLTAGEKSEYEWFSGCSRDVLYKKGDYPGKDLKGYIPDSGLMIKYKASTTKYTNTELFKKYGIGLAYRENDISNGEDVDSFEFQGWYYDKYGVNPYDETKRLTKNTTVYARWKTVYPSGPVNSYKVTFDSNCADGREEYVYNMGPDDKNILVNGITVEENSYITAPMITPKRSGYKFTGWYTTAECLQSQLFDYNNSITADMTLYAGWEPLCGEGTQPEKVYSLKFDANTGNRDDDTEVPDVIKDYHSNGLLSDLRVPVVTEPKRKGYTFAGWYYNRACTKIFNFGEDLTDNITSDTITLYAKWVDDNSQDGYSLQLNDNKPESAINDVVLTDSSGKNVDNIKADKAGFADPGMAAGLKVYLDGNITAKLNKYTVSVITITPGDINGDDEIASHNRELIDRADLIVINQTVNKSFSELWKKYKNTDLFCKDNYTDEALSKKTFDDNDLDWVATERIWKKVSVGSGRDKTPAPMFFDYSIYENAKRTGTASDRLQKRYFSDDSDAVPSEIELYKGKKVSSNNAFKLYLLTQQMNPVTLYKAYLAYPGGNSSKGGKNWSSCCIDKKGRFLNEKNSDAATAWNEDILLPYEAMVKSDYDNNKAQVLESLGFKENPVIERSAVNYRTIVAHGNMLKEFVRKELLAADMDMQEYMNNKNITGMGDGGDRYMITDGLYYLLNSRITTTSVERNLNILEIQPGDAAGVFKTSAYWYWYIARYVTNYSGEITTRSMSSYEFIGKVFDLNAEFDVIYIGGNDSNLPSETSNGMPDNGKGGKYAYAHSGTVNQNKDDYTRTAGILGDNTEPVTTAVYPGNDITKVKYDELLYYAGTGYPIVFGRDMIKNTSLVDFNSITADDINTDKIDKASYIYELMHTLMTEQKNGEKVYDGSYFFENQYNSRQQNKKFTEALTVKKFSVDVVPPLEYRDKTKNESLTDKDIYINGADIEDRNLRFSLTINSQADNNYIVRLYIDTNADGKFAEEEKLDSLEVYDETTGRYVRYNKLIRNHTYRIERAISDYVGAIPWSMDVIDAANTGVRCTKRGMCAIKQDDKTKEESTLNILQVVTDTKEGNSYDNNLYLPTQAEISKAELKYKADHGGQNTGITKDNKDIFFYQMNKAGDDIGKEYDNRQLAKNAGNFYYYISQVNDFSININRLTVTELKSKIAQYPDYFKNNEEGGEGKTIEYDMLILGFADCYSDIEDEHSLALIEKFINEGNLVLFTHDTTSFVNVPRPEYEKLDKKRYWGYNINQYYRGILGMDRYDVKNNKGIANDANTANASDWVFKPGSSQSESKKKNDYITVSNSKTNKILAQGLTKYVLNGHVGNPLCKSVSKVNDGQVSSYPYKLDDNFKVSDTHPQYYQLDMESDDIVVWYTLYDPGQNVFKLKNDVRNDYYIYNKGNITYSGVGHANNMTDMETKLFVNTMVAAYNATVRSAEPVITNADKSTDNNDTDFLYVDYDATTTDEAVPFGEGVGKVQVKNMDSSDSDGRLCKRTYFTLKNNSIVINKMMSVHYFPVIENKYGHEVILDGRHMDPDTNKLAPYVELPLTTCRYEMDDSGRSGEALPHLEAGKEPVVDGVKYKYGTRVESGEYYYVDVPIQDEYYSSVRYDGDTKRYQALDKANKFKIQVQIVMRYGKDISASIPLVGKRDVVYMRRGNFILD